MFKGKTFILLIYFCYLSVSWVNGQKFYKGLIFSTQGDTARGMVSQPENYMPVHICYFKPAGDDGTVLLNAKEIEGFQTSGQTYISTRIRLNKTDTMLFTTQIFKGIKELRYFELRKRKHFIIVSPDSTLQEIQYPPELKSAEVLSGMTSEKKFHLQVDSIFPDAPDLPEYEKGVNPDLISMQNLFRQYHNPPYTRIIGSTSKTVLPKEFRKGLIITTTKDTIQGFFTNTLEKTLYRTCIFTPDILENAMKFLPGEIAGFGNISENKFFNPVKLLSAGKDTSVFVRLLLEGTVDLLYYNSDGADHFLLRDNREQTHQVSYPPVMSKQDYLSGLSRASKFRKQADSIFSVLNIPGKPIKPEIRSMIRLLEDYHESLSLPFSKYYGMGRRIELGIVAGVRFEDYLAEVNNDGYMSFSDPAPYLGLYFTIFNKASKLGMVLRNTVGYHTDNYSYIEQFNDYSIFRQTSVKSLADNFDAGIIFRPLRKWVLNPFIETGGSAKYYFKTNYENYSEMVIQDNIYSSHNHEDLNSEFFFGGFARIGLTKAIRPKNSVSFSCGYSYLMNTGSDMIHSADVSIIYNFLRK